MREFLGETPTATRGQGSSGGGSSGGQGAKSGGRSSKSGGGGGAPAPAPALIDSTTSGGQYAAQLDNPTWSRRSKLPIYYPTKLVPGSELTSDSRSYPIDGPGNSVYYVRADTEPSVSVALARLQVPVTQWVGLLQRSPRAPALQVQPAPAESWAQRPSLQSLSSLLSQGVPTAPSLQVPSLLPPPLRQ